MTHEHILMLTALLFYIAAIYLVYAFISKSISMIRSYLFRRKLNKAIRAMWEAIQDIQPLPCEDITNVNVCENKKCIAKAKVKCNGTKRSAKRAKKNPARAKKQ